MNNRAFFKERFISVASNPLPTSNKENFITLSAVSKEEDQNSTNSAFSKKWTDYNDSTERESLFKMQKDWYLELYGFQSEAELAEFLKDKNVIFDAGCGIGFKAAWLAQLAPHALVVGMDFSEAAELAAQNYSAIENLFFVRNDIAEPFFKTGSVDYVSCDQVIMHTYDPEKTFAELSRVTNPEKGQFACYFYAKKALPRELIDDYFRIHCTDLSHDQLMEFSDQMTELGKRLSALNATIDVPDIPTLGIKGGEMDIQRFVYWNFLKCYWNETLGRQTSTMINFDWYSPTNARRYSQEEVEQIAENNSMNIITFHKEEACYSGRFARAKAA